jgi:hypothetical protein
MEQPLKNSGREAARMIPADRQVTLEFKRRLEEIITVLDVRAFDSRARGEAAPDSDLDIFVEVASLTPALRRRIAEIAWEVGFERDYIISPLWSAGKSYRRGRWGPAPSSWRSSGKECRCEARATGRTGAVLR